MIFIIYFLL